MVFFSLLLLAVTAFSTFYFYVSISNQFELGRKSTHEKRLKELGALLGQGAGKLLTLAELVPVMSGMEARLSSGSVKNISQAFDRHWQTLQLGAAVDMAQIYSAAGEQIQIWNSEGIKPPDSGFTRAQVRKVNETEGPLTLLDCTNECMQLAMSPMMARDRSAGVVVLGATPAASIVSFREVSGADIGILNVDRRKQVSAEQRSRRIASWGLRILALTNLDQNLPLLQAASGEASVAQFAKGMRKVFNGHEFEIYVVPVKQFAASGDAYFVLIDDITEQVRQIRDVNNKNILVNGIGLVLSESLLLLILWGPLSRLRRSAEVLPLLASNAFEQVRNAVRRPHRNRWYKDEFDILDDTLVTVSRQLEGLQSEVAIRTVEIRQANKLLSNLNEELESKVQERTRQLQEAQEELVRREKLSLLGQVAGSVGHELRNPLGVMSNAVYFLETVMPEADEVTKEYLNIIKAEITGAERIVSDLLDSVRTKMPQPQTVSVKDLIDQTLRKYTVPASVTLNLDFPETLPPLHVDPQQIHQVFRNLISNGVEAMQNGGVMTISAVENRPEGTVTVSVRDTGTGISPEQRERLFQPLFTTKARGIGLGLVVVKNLTQANGGSIEVQSESGKGTTFFITLPCDYPAGESS